MKIHSHIPVGEIAATIPHVTKLFDVLGIDYVLHGGLSLRDACAEAGVDPVTVQQSIDALPRGDGEHPAWSDSSMQQMLDELRDHRHPKLRTMLAETATALATVPAAGRPGIPALREAFAALCDALQPHMTHEEHMLFPVIQHLEDCWTKNERPSMQFVGGVMKPVAALVGEHSEIMDKLKLVHEAAGAIDEDRICTEALDAVANLEHEIREHIHLENNVLYPRATALEAAVAK